MENSSSSLLAIKIDFEQSHIFFPTIIVWTLAILLVLILIFNGIPYLRSFLNGERTLNLSLAHVDKIRLPGTLILTVLYFLLMDYVGTFFPNMGYGFLFVSIPFIFLISILYVHDINRKKLVAITLNAFIAPSLAWFLLAKIFSITLP